MKYLLIILFALCGLKGFSQYTRITNPLQYTNLRADTFNLAPGDTILGRNRTAGQLRFKNSDKKLYVWNGTKWESAGTGGGGSSYTNSYGILLNSSAFSADTTAITTRARVDQLLLGKQNTLSATSGLQFVTGNVLSLGGPLVNGVTQITGRTQTLSLGTNSNRLNTVFVTTRNGIYLKDSVVNGFAPYVNIGIGEIHMAGQIVTIDGPVYLTEYQTGGAPKMVTVTSDGSLATQTIPTGGGSGGTETDPIFTTHPAYSITSPRLIRWDSAYNWGNHANFGYLTSTSGDTLYSRLSHTHTFSSLTSKPTTITGYGITDATLQATTMRGATTTDGLTIGGLSSLYTSTGAGIGFSVQGKSGNSRIAKFGDETNSEKFFITNAGNYLNNTTYITGLANTTPQILTVGAGGVVSSIPQIVSSAYQILGTSAGGVKKGIPIYYDSATNVEYGDTGLERAANSMVNNYSKSYVQASSEANHKISTTSNQKILPNIYDVKEYVDSSVHTAAGSNQQITFNDAGATAGDVRFLWDKGTAQLNINGRVITSTIRTTSPSGSTAVNTKIGSPSGGLVPFDFNGVIHNLITSDYTGFSSGGAATWGSITGTLSAQTDLNTALGLKSPLASPTFTGTPAAPTAAVGTNTTQLATTGNVKNSVDSTVLQIRITSGTSFTIPNSIAKTIELFIDPASVISAFSLYMAVSSAPSQAVHVYFGEDSRISNGSNVVTAFSAFNNDGSNITQVVANPTTAVSGDHIMYTINNFSSKWHR